MAGAQGREHDLAKSLRRTIAGQHDGNDLGHLVDTQQRIVEKITLIGAAV
jgi:hypothetical protein